jgi:hypothetical protein
VDLDEWERVALPEGALVVRGGESSVETLLLNAERGLAKDGVSSVSAGCLPDAELSEILSVYPVPHGKLRWTTVGDLVAAGFGVRPTHYHGHVSIDPPMQPFSRDQAAQLEAVFRPAETNVHRRPPGAASQ